jgi:hypothetical protein
MRTRSHRWGRNVALAALLGTGVPACVTLTPITAIHQVDLDPLAADGDYRIDPTANSAVFVKEGLQIKVRHLNDAELNVQYPGAENPFTFRGEVDPGLGHVPTRFTVFQVSVNNPTFDKVLLPPERAVLVTDRGAVMRPYQLTRAEARGHIRNFETYWLSRGVQSGNMQKLYLERMGTLRGAAYHRDSFVFKGNSYSGKIVFDPLPPGTDGVTLHFDRFVLEFGIYDTPKVQMDLDFAFAVRSGIVDPEEERQDVSTP